MKNISSNNHNGGHFSLASPHAGLYGFYQHVTSKAGRMRAQQTKTSKITLKNQNNKLNYKINIPFSGDYLIADQRAKENAHCVIDLINMEDLAFSRELLSGHVTGSAFVLNETRDKVLLTHHAALNKWLQLGGHCDGIKDPAYTALKEAYEESGLTHIRPLSGDILDIDIQTIPTSAKAPEHLHYDIRYVFEADENERFTVTVESHDLKWVPLQDLEAYNSDHGVLVMREKLPNLLS